MIINLNTKEEVISHALHGVNAQGGRVDVYL